MFFSFLIKEKTFAPFLGHLFYLSNTTKLSESFGIPSGYLSGISHHHVPKYLRSRRLPTMGTNAITNYKDRLDLMWEEIKEAPISYLGGTPPWLIDFLRTCETKEGKPAKELFPRLRCIGTGAAPRLHRTNMISKNFSTTAK